MFLWGGVIPCLVGVYGVYDSFISYYGYRNIMKSYDGYFLDKEYARVARSGDKLAEVEPLIDWGGFSADYSGNV